MVIEPAVLVIENDQERGVPELFVLSEGIIDFAKQTLGPHRRMWRMIVILLAFEIVGLNEAVLWK